ncbi:MAG: hypothetical protein JSS65_15235 [Armatimonadetes bacterium]|nr:hypothetical protein [Armatimonadota bacterium]
MTTVDLCRSQCETTAKQLERVLDGMPASSVSFKLYDDFCSAQEVVAHLAECTVALFKSLKGESHGWGSHHMVAETAEGQMAEYRASRAAALEAAFADGSDSALQHVFSYIVLHDAYHVGQLCAVRAKLEGWNTESIYA